MEPHTVTTPFGRRTMTLGLIAAQTRAKERPADASVHKWNVFRAICTAKESLGLAERSLAVLDALLSFHPETVLAGDGLVVFPSNEQLALRAHGMPRSTLRKHLAALVDAGVVLRRDSPNGKRYARKGRAGEIECAFGFDLSPLVARAEEFEELAERVRAEERALKFAKERVTLARRDVAKMIVTGIEERVPINPASPSFSNWEEAHGLYRSIVARIPRSPTAPQLEPIAAELTRLAAEIVTVLERHNKTNKAGSNESENERHKQNSNPNKPTELEPAFEESGVTSAPAPEREATRIVERGYPLALVLQACPDIADFVKGGIANWRELTAAARLTSSFLGISPSAWQDAVDAMGEGSASIVVAAILQRGPAIGSAGGYLRALTDKARRREFSIGPMLMALIGARNREKRRAYALSQAAAG